MIATIILAVLIGLYFLWVIRKKYKDAKKGKFCNCGCSDCPSSGKKCKKE